MSGRVRTIGAVTSGRSDYGCLVPILRNIQTDSALRLRLFVTGMHLAPGFGLTVRAIEEDGFDIGERIETMLSSDTPSDVARSAGLGVVGFAQALSRSRPDFLLVLGDRLEILSAAVAALPFQIPIAHVHGGELTEGAVDDAVRHALTKMSHLHFVATEVYAARVLQMGEEPWRVSVTGAPSLDHLREVALLSREELATRYGCNRHTPYLLITYHPVTLGRETTEQQVHELLAALEASGLGLIFTYPNADVSSATIIRMLRAFVARSPRARLFVNVGTHVYFSLMQHAAAMVGNSSSGLIEAPSFRLGVVNVGPRQSGRLRAANVIDVECAQHAILQGIHHVVSPTFRASLDGLVNPYGDGYASERIVGRLREVPLTDQLLTKRFCDRPAPVAPETVSPEAGETPGAIALAGGSQVVRTDGGGHVRGEG